jgi:hypothetical protein
MTSNLKQITSNNTEFAEVVGVNTEDHMQRIARLKCFLCRLFALSYYHGCPVKVMILSLNLYKTKTL